MVLQLQYRQKIAFQLFLTLFLQCSAILNVYAQSDREQVLNTRKASNQALKVFDREQQLSYLTDDVQITTGNGTLIQGKSALRSYMEKSVGSQIYFVRTSTEVEVNSQRGLAWETGTWQGYDLSKGQQATTGGKYAAQWTKTAEGWRIKSELFVTLE